jgi:sialate O-acetylesterase
MKFLPALLLATTLPAVADVRLPALISDHMVLLAEPAANVWGWADPGEKVTVKLGTITADTNAGADGRWSVKLRGQTPGMAGDMTITGKNTLTVKDVAVGEVWLASGQSNMEWTLAKSANAEKELAAANFPGIRVFTVARKGSEKLLDDTVGKWDVATPQTAGGFSGVGYFFARELHHKLKQPVGLIHASWGGTPVETWMPESALRANPAFLDHWKRTVDNYPAAKAKSDAAQTEFRAASEAAKAAGKPGPAAPPRPPDGPDALYVAPGGLYAGMIAPVAPYTIRGAIWYQGESNAGPNNRGNMDLYAQLFPTLILGWRYEFGKAQGVTRDDSEFPFLFVQLPNYQARVAEPTDSYWAVIREAQAGALEIPRTGMATTIDLGEPNNIHPTNKQDVGHRLALAALAQVYFQEIEFSGPLYGGMQVEDDKIRLSFSNSTGMKSKDGGPLKGFALAGADKKFVWADAKLEGDHVIVSNAAIKEPVAVRYAWADNPEGNLVNEGGLPAAPFRSDKWPQTPPPNSAGSN